jgi:two-component system, OmpR family, sensor histidine kinase QseC
MTSLRSRVVVMVLVAIGALFVPLAIGSYLFMMEEVDELFDARLTQNAKTLIAFEAVAASAGEEESAVTVPSSQPKSERHRLVVRGHPYENQVGFQIWNDANVLLMASSDLSNLAIDAAPAGFADVTVNNRRWRVFTMLGEDHRWIRVGERYDSRREIGRALAVEAVFPILIAFPLLALLVGAAVHRGMQPLRRLAEQLTVRRSEDPNPIGGNYFDKELYPVVSALNGLLRRLQQTLESERAFTTNAAHELRTPLAGALIHLENARSTTDPKIAEAALRDAQHGLNRLSHLVNQLLDLARWDAGQVQPMTPTDLNACVDEELSLLGVALSSKNIHLAWRPSPLPRVHGWAPGLQTVVRNLLDNAIRYSADGQSIEIATFVRDREVVLAIVDQGPGIPAEQRAAAFQRFRRGDVDAAGSGIGLSLVARILEVHRAHIALDDGPDARGLRIEVRFPIVSLL